MPSDRYPPRMNTLTPVPIEDISTISRSINKMGTAITRIDSAVSTIKDDLLPPVAEAAKDARDGVLKLNGRVTALENIDHKCVDEDRQLQQDSDISDNKTAIVAATTYQKNIGRLFGLLASLAIVIGGAAVGFALATRSDTTEAKTQLRDLDGVDERVAEHSVKIEVLEKAQAADRAIYLQTVKAIPVKVEQAARERALTVDEIADATDDLPMATWERDALKRILTKVRARNKQLHGNR